MIGRSRTIQPGTFTDAALWDAAQRTGLPLLQAFEGLWCYADREGRFEWKPRELKLVILPFWDGSFEETLAALVADGFVVPYEVNGRRYGVVRNFKKHQHINPKEQASRLPPVPRGTRESRDGDATNSRSDQEFLGLFLDPDRDQDSEDPDLALSQPSDLTGSAREDDENDDENSAPVEKKSPFKSEAEREAFGHWAGIVWRKAHPKGEARATPRRLTPLRARLREGATPADIKRACEAVTDSAFHFGDNESGVLHIEPKTLFGNAEKLEKWLTKRTAKVSGQTEHDRAQAERDEALMAEIRAGVWGEQARKIAGERSIDLRLFRQAVHAGKVTRIGPAPAQRAIPVVVRAIPKAKPIGVTREQAAQLAALDKP